MVIITEEELEELELEVQREAKCSYCTLTEPSDVGCTLEEENGSTIHKHECKRCGTEKTIGIYKIKAPNSCPLIHRVEFLPKEIRP